MQKNEYLDLVKKIQKYNKQYYEFGNSEISDAEYDQLYNQLEKIESEHPEWTTSNSPTQYVGAGSDANASGLPKIEHGSPLLSINNKSTDIKDLLNWYEKMGGDGTEVIIEPKLDGITLNVTYKSGHLVQAATRGNGYIGEDVTTNAKQIINLPHTLPICNDNEYCELRGECIIPYDFFKKHLAKDFSNPRNTIAGIMRKLDCKDIAKYGATLMLYDWGKTENYFIEDSDADDVRFIGALNLPSLPFKTVNNAKELQEIVETRLDGYIKQIDGFNVLQWNNYPQAVCDGIVIKVNSLKKREEIGFSEKGPKWAFAYKFKPLSAATRIDHVEWQIGKSGK